MSPREFTNNFIISLREDGYFDANLVSEELLSEHILRRSETNLVRRGTERLTEKDVKKCIDAATREFIQQEITKNLELGILSISVDSSGHMMYVKDLDKAKELGFI